MTDIVDSATRSRMMSGIRSKNTKAEVEIRKRLFAAGFRYRLHDKKLPGKPDIIFPRYKGLFSFMDVSGMPMIVHFSNGLQAKKASGRQS